MICPSCKAQGFKSCVYPGVSSRTAMYFQPYYDEDGKLHHHDGNTTTTEYSCDRGHTWSERERGKCWCGWEA